MSIPEQNNPHPDPLPSDGRGNSQTRLSQLPKRLDMPPDGGRFSLSHPMGEGRGEGVFTPKSEVVFARVLSFVTVTFSPSAPEPARLPSDARTLQKGGSSPGRKPSMLR